MSMYDGEDALDRALFALPLEEPPAGLRASILMATSYRPAPAFSFLELGALGVAGAVAVWFAVLLVLGGGSLFVHTLATISSVISRALASPATLAWLAAGGATALWVSLFNGFAPVTATSYRSGRRAGR